MALPTAWQLLLPNLNAYTVIGLILLAIVFFGNGFIIFFSQLLSLITPKKVRPSSIRYSLITISLLLIFLVSFLQDMTSTTEGIVVLIGGIVFIFSITVTISGYINRKNSRSDKKIMR